MLVFWGLTTASAGVVITLFIALVSAILLVAVQSLRLKWSRQEAAVAAKNLLEQEALSSLGRMVAGVAHEMNTPLSAISCSVDTQKKATEMMDAALAELATPGADTAASLTRCEKALRALRSSDDVVDLAITSTKELVRVLRLTGRPADDEAQAVDINQMIKDSLLLLSHELKMGVTVDLELGDVSVVSGWPVALGQVMLNLVQNARQALGEKGLICIRSQMQGGEVVITVSDDGPGLPAGCAQRLFKPGFTTKTAAEGTGLGLYISDKIVARHGGQIKAGNRPSGGAEFVVTLPAAS